jgi:serine/threonine-protein kinase
MILGTAAYMAPEQAKGRAVDRRADVWAFGVVCFEMLAGRRTFEGDDVSEVLASVLKTEPDWSALPADLPGPVRRLLRRCLEKDPKRRLRDVGEGMLQLEEGLATGATTSVSTPVELRSSNVDVRTSALRRALPIVATALVTAAIVVGVIVWRTPPPPVAPAAIRFRIEPAATAPVFFTPSHQDLAMSPDGKSVVYVALAASRPLGLWVRRLDQLDAAPLRGGENAVEPFISPDSEWVGFVDQSEPSSLKKVSILGGPVVPLAKAKDTVLGVAWTHDHAIVMGVSGNGLHSVADSGGAVVPLTTLDAAANESDHVWPAEVPGTPVILFVTSSRSLSIAGSAQLAAVDRASGRVVRFKLPGSHPRFVAPDHMVYAAADGSLRAVTFDPKTMTISGNPVPVLEGVGIKTSGASNFDVSRDGRLVYCAVGNSFTAARTIAWADRSGKETAIPAPARNYFYVRISPDNTHLSLDVRDEDQDIWTWDLKREAPTRLTDRPGAEQYGLWTPTGDRIVFSSAAGNVTDLYSIRPDGTGTVEQLTDMAKDKLTPFPNAITPDGKQVVFRAGSSLTQNDLFVVSMTGDRIITKVLATEHDELNATLSPDGKWMALQSDLSGHAEVYVRPFPNADAAQYPVSTAGGSKPLWAKSGTEIFYVSADNKIMSAPVSTAHGFVAGKPVVLFDGAPYFSGGVGRNYDVTGDGKRFALVKNPPMDASRGSAPLIVVLNWAQELAGRAR